MKTSFVIVSFNTRQLTLNCIKSIYKHEKKDFEVIVVDNASTDGSVPAISKQFPQVKLIVNEHNLGFSQANNQGISASSGEYIILLNSDTELIEPLSDKLISRFRDSRVGAVVPQLLNPDRSLQASVFRLPTLASAIKEYWLGQSFAHSKYTPSSDQIATVEAAVMACMCVPRRIFDQLGGLDEKYFMYFEDLEFCRRLKRNNYQITYDPGVQLLHHHGASGASDSRGWKRLIPGSKLYHGVIIHYLISFVLYTGQKFTNFKLR